jgi:hypothetical protein
MKRLVAIWMLVWGVLGLSLLSYERVQRVCEFACGHDVPAIPARLHAPSKLTTPNKCAPDASAAKQHTFNAETIIDHGRKF